MKRDWKSLEVRVPPSSMSRTFTKTHGYEARRAAEKDMMAAKLTEKSIKDSFKAKRAMQAAQTVAKQERKKNSDIQAGNIQIIKSTKKLRKFDRKAMETVFKMSTEQIQALSQKKTTFSGRMNHKALAEVRL
jgi:hypothetical protein